MRNIEESQTADLYTKVQITFTISKRISAEEFNDQDLLEDWIYMHLTEHNANIEKVDVLETELSDID